MNLKTYKINIDGNFSDHKLNLNSETSTFFSNISDHVFNEWNDRFRSGKREISISLTLKENIFPILKKMNSNLDGNCYDCKYFFGHTSSIDKKIMSIVFQNTDKKNKFLILLQNKHHKSKFKLNTSTMTITDIKDRFTKIYSILRKDIIPEVYAVCLHDYEGLSANHVYIANKRHLELKKA